MQSWHERNVDLAFSALDGKTEAVSELAETFFGLKAVRYERKSAVAAAPQ